MRRIRRRVFVGTFLLMGGVRVRGLSGVKRTGTVLSFQLRCNCKGRPRRFTHARTHGVKRTGTVLSFQHSLKLQRAVPAVSPSPPFHGDGKF